MNYSFILLAGLVAISCTLACGCAQPAQSPAQTPVATTIIPTTVPATSTPVPAQTSSLSPGPTQTLPANVPVIYKVERDTNSHNPAITLTLEGGDGLGLIKEAALFVVRSDGSIAEGRAEWPKRGSTITLVGTPTRDRVIIWFTMNAGDKYKVYDQEVPFVQLG